MAALNHPQYTQTLTAVSPVSESAHLSVSYLHKLKCNLHLKKILIKTLLCFRAQKLKFILHFKRLKNVR